ncbi:hypothetical protein BLNAU_10282 [Blattamonas nauphoetae]|uniref:Uncharacterized protein n=1 Tax=Blattamonas nauphoetae TaxID=2049346 RepID=A0ABQ9XTI7_9EUKA|nr:hypothetical protein BLNAU_10282 [Blattamonas nauphoetae]
MAYTSITDKIKLAFPHDETTQQILFGVLHELTEGNQDEWTVFKSFDSHLTDHQDLREDFLALYNQRYSPKPSSNQVPVLQLPTNPIPQSSEPLSGQHTPVTPVPPSPFSTSQNSSFFHPVAGRMPTSSPPSLSTGSFHGSPVQSNFTKNPIIANQLTSSSSISPGGLQQFPSQQDTTHFTATSQFETPPESPQQADYPSQSKKKKKRKAVFGMKRRRPNMNTSASDYNPTPQKTRRTQLSPPQGSPYSVDQTSPQQPRRLRSPRLGSLADLAPPVPIEPPLFPPEQNYLGLADLEDAFQKPMNLPPDLLHAMTQFDDLKNDTDHAFIIVTPTDPRHQASSLTTQFMNGPETRHEYITLMQLKSVLSDEEYFRLLQTLHSVCKKSIKQSPSKASPVKRLDERSANNAVLSLFSFLSTILSSHKSRGLSSSSHVDFHTPVPNVSSDSIPFFLSSPEPTTSSIVPLHHQFGSILPDPDWMDPSHPVSSILSLMKIDKAQFQDYLRQKASGILEQREDLRNRELDGEDVSAEMEALLSSQPLLIDSDYSDSPTPTTFQLASTIHAYRKITPSLTTTTPSPSPCASATSFARSPSPSRLSPSNGIVHPLIPPQLAYKGRSYSILPASEETPINVDPLNLLPTPFQKRKESRRTVRNRKKGGVKGDSVISFEKLNETEKFQRKEAEKELQLHAMITNTAIEAVFKVFEKIVKESSGENGNTLPQTVSPASVETILQTMGRTLTDLVALPLPTPFSSSSPLLHNLLLSHPTGRELSFSAADKSVHDLLQFRDEDEREVTDIWLNRLKSTLTKLIPLVNMIKYLNDEFKESKEDIRNYHQEQKLMREKRRTERRSKRVDSDDEKPTDEPVEPTATPTKVKREHSGMMKMVSYDKTQSMDQFLAAYRDATLQMNRLCSINMRQSMEATNWKTLHALYSSPHVPLSLRSLHQNHNGNGRSAAGQMQQLSMFDEFARFIRSEAIHALPRIVPRLRMAELLLTSKRVGPESGQTPLTTILKETEKWRRTKCIVPERWLADDPLGSLDEPSTLDKDKNPSVPIKRCLSPLDLAQAKALLTVPLANRTTKLKFGVSLDGMFEQPSSKGDAISLHPLPPTQPKLLVSPLSVLPFTNTAFPPPPLSVFLLSIVSSLHKHAAKAVNLNSNNLRVRTPTNPSTPVSPKQEVELDMFIPSSHTLVTELSTPRTLSLHLAIPNHVSNHHKTTPDLLTPQHRHQFLLPTPPILSTNTSAPHSHSFVTLATLFSLQIVSNWSTIQQKAEKKNNTQPVLLRPFQSLAAVPQYPLSRTFSSPQPPPPELPSLTERRATSPAATTQPAITNPIEPVTTPDLSQPESFAEPEFALPPYITEPVAMNTITFIVDILLESFFSDEVFMKSKETRLWHTLLKHIKHIRLLHRKVEKARKVVHMDQIGQETVSALERMISEEEKVCVTLFGSIQKLQTRTKYLETHNHFMLPLFLNTSLFILLDNLLSLITLLSNTQAIIDDATYRPFIPSPNLHFTHLITSSLHDEANSEQQLSHSLSTDSSNPKHAVFTELFSDLSRISHLPMVVPLSSSATQPSQESIEYASLFSPTTDEIGDSDSPLVNTSPTSDQNPSFCSDLISVLSPLSFTFCRTNHCAYSFSVSNDPNSPRDTDSPTTPTYLTPSKNRILPSPLISTTTPLHEETTKAQAIPASKWFFTSFFSLLKQGWPFNTAPADGRQTQLGESMKRFHQTLQTSFGQVVTQAKLVGLEGECVKVAKALVDVSNDKQALLLLGLFAESKKWNEQKLTQTNLEPINPKAEAIVNSAVEWMSESQPNAACTNLVSSPEFKSLALPFFSSLYSSAVDSANDADSSSPLAKMILSFADLPRTPSFEGIMTSVQPIQSRLFTPSIPFNIHKALPSNRKHAFTGRHTLNNPPPLKAPTFTPNSLAALRLSSSLQNSDSGFGPIEHRYLSKAMSIINTPFFAQTNTMQVVYPLTVSYSNRSKILTVEQIDANALSIISLGIHVNRSRHFNLTNTFIKPRSVLPVTELHTGSLMLVDENEKQQPSPLFMSFHPIILNTQNLSPAGVLSRQTRSSARRPHSPQPFISSSQTPRQSYSRPSTSPQPALIQPSLSPATEDVEEPMSPSIVAHTHRLFKKPALVEKMRKKAEEKKAEVNMQPMLQRHPPLSPPLTPQSMVAPSKPSLFSIPQIQSFTLPSTRSKPKTLQPPKLAPRPTPQIPINKRPLTVFESVTSAPLAKPKVTPQPQSPTKSRAQSPSASLLAGQTLFITHQNEIATVQIQPSQMVHPLAHSAKKSGNAMTSSKRPSLSMSPMRQEQKKQFTPSPPSAERIAQPVTPSRQQIQLSPTTRSDQFHMSARLHTPTTTRTCLSSSPSLSPSQRTPPAMIEYEEKIVLSRKYKYVMKGRTRMRVEVEPPEFVEKIVRRRYNPSRTPSNDDHLWRRVPKDQVDKYPMEESGSEPMTPDSMISVHNEGLLSTEPERRRVSEPIQFRDKTTTPPYLRRSTEHAHESAVASPRVVQNRLSLQFEEVNLPVLRFTNSTTAEGVQTRDMILEIPEVLGKDEETEGTHDEQAVPATEPAMVKEPAKETQDSLSQNSSSSIQFSSLSRQSQEQTPSESKEEGDTHTPSNSIAQEPIPNTQPSQARSPSPEPVLPPSGPLSQPLQAEQDVLMSSDQTPYLNKASVPSDDSETSQLPIQTTPAPVRISPSHSRPPTPPISVNKSPLSQPTTSSPHRPSELTPSPLPFSPVPYPPHTAPTVTPPPSTSLEAPSSPSPPSSPSDSSSSAFLSQLTSGETPAPVSETDDFFNTPQASLIKRQSQDSPKQEQKEEKEEESEEQESEDDMDFLQSTAPSSPAARSSPDTPRSASTSPDFLSDLEGMKDEAGESLGAAQPMVFEPIPPLAPPAPSLMRPKEEEEKEPTTEMLIDQTETIESDVQKKEEESIVADEPVPLPAIKSEENSLPPSESQDDSGTIDDSAESAPKSNTFAPKPDPQLDPHPHSRRDLISSDAELFSSSDDAHPPIPRSSLTDSNGDEYTLPTSQSMVGLKKKKPRKSARFSANRSSKKKRMERQQKMLNEQMEQERTNSEVTAKPKTKKKGRNIKATKEEKTNSVFQPSTPQAGGKKKKMLMKQPPFGANKPGLLLMPLTPRSTPQQHPLTPQLRGQQLATSLTGLNVTASLLQPLTSTSSTTQPSTPQPSVSLRSRRTSLSPSPNVGNDRGQSPTTSPHLSLISTRSTQVPLPFSISLHSLVSTLIIPAKPNQTVSPAEARVTPQKGRPPNDPPETQSISFNGIVMHIVDAERQLRFAARDIDTLSSYDLGRLVFVLKLLVLTLIGPDNKLNLLSEDVLTRFLDFAMSKYDGMNVGDEEREWRETARMRMSPAPHVGTDKVIPVSSSVPRWQQYSSDMEERKNRDHTTLISIPALGMIDGQPVFPTFCAVDGISITNFNLNSVERTPLSGTNMDERRREREREKKERLEREMAQLGNKKGASLWAKSSLGSDGQEIKEDVKEDSDEWWDEAEPIIESRMRDELSSLPSLETEMENRRKACLVSRAQQKLIAKKKAEIVESYFSSLSLTLPTLYPSHPPAIPSPPPPDFTPVCFSNTGIVQVVIAYPSAHLGLLQRASVADCWKTNSKKTEEPVSSNHDNPPPPASPEASLVQPLNNISKHAQAVQTLPSTAPSVCFTPFISVPTPQQPSYGVISSPSFLRSTLSARKLKSTQRTGTSFRIDRPTGLLLFTPIQIDFCVIHRS